ncbi:MAG: NAD-dependent epimerase/dehydratase family protein [Ginsengibacter sp.]
MGCKPRIIVTGAAGFLGGRTAKFLAQDPGYVEYDIVATSRRTTRAQELEGAGCGFKAGDLTDLSFCNDLTKQAEIVIHCAALSAPYGDYAEFYKSNYIATGHLLKASVENGVKKFIFISTPSIYFTFSDRFNVKETDPLPRKMPNNYAKTKLMAERKVVSLNGRGIETIALRPRAIIGAEDSVIFPRLLKAYASGKLRIIGPGQNVADLTCARNVIEAIVCAIHAPNESMGAAYNISNGAPVQLWDEINYLLNGLGYPPVKKRIPYGVIRAISLLTELLYKIKRSRSEPVLTSYGIGMLSKSLTMDISLARIKLGYAPVQTTREGIDEFLRWYKNSL